MPRTSGDIVNALKSLKKQYSLSIGSTKHIADLTERGFVDSFRQITIRVQCRDRNRPVSCSNELGVRLFLRKTYRPHTCDPTRTREIDISPIVSSACWFVKSFPARYVVSPYCPSGGARGGEEGLSKCRVVVVKTPVHRGKPGGDCRGRPTLPEIRDGQSFSCPSFGRLSMWPVAGGGSRGRPKVRHGRQECQSGWLKMATR